MKRLSLAGISLATLSSLLFIYACSDDELGGAALPDASTDPQPGPDSSYTPDSSSPIADAAQPDAAQPDAAQPDAATCTIPNDATVSAEIKVSADDYLKLWVNGVLVDDKTTTWQTVDTRTVTLFRNPNRKNVIAVEARNAFNAGGYDRGLLVDLGVDAGADAGTDAGAPRIVTDLTWKIIGTTTDGGVPAGGLADGGTAGVAAWFEPGFDDSTWHPPFDEGPHGMSPWGSLFGTSAARWLWSYDSSTEPSKPIDDVIYFRKTFYLDVAGQPQSTPPGCL